MFFLQIIPRKWPQKIDILGRTFRMGVWQSGEHVAKSSFKTQSFFWPPTGFCFGFFFFLRGGGGNFPVQCLGHAYVNGQLVFTCVFAFDHLAKCLQTSSFEKLFSLFLRTEYWLAEFTSNTLLSPTAILCNDLDNWCFSFCKKTNGQVDYTNRWFASKGKKMDDILVMNAQK